MLLEMQTGAGGPPEAVEGVWLILRVGTCEKKRIFFLCLLRSISYYE